MVSAGMVETESQKSPKPLEFAPAESYISLAVLSLSKKVDYALISLAYLVEHQGRISSARAIAEAHDLPLSLLMNLLKSMHGKGILCSERGSKGGYQICTNLDDLTLYDLIEAVEDAEDRENPAAKRLCGPPALRALQYKLISFLKQVRVSDLVVPGRRIEVPAELLSNGRKCNCRNEPKIATTV
jgi:Rrf2 family protein